MIIVVTTSASLGADDNYGRVLNSEAVPTEVQGSYERQASMSDDDGRIVMLNGCHERSGGGAPNG